MSRSNTLQASPLLGSGLFKTLIADVVFRRLLKFVFAIAAAEIVGLAFEFGPIFHFFVDIHTANGIDRHGALLGLLI
jgi:hypothetical protein